MLYLAVAIDTLHALLMVGWIVGLPLLFWRRWPKVSFVYCIFSIAFIIVNQVSHYTLGECVFTTIADWFYAHAGHNAPDEWFTVRMSRLVFGVVPSHRGIKVATEILIGISAVGGMLLFFKRKVHATRKEN
jgi:hypothetical protein